MIQFLNGLLDDNLSFLLDMIQRFMKSVQAMEKDTRVQRMHGYVKRRINSLERQDLIDIGYDMRVLHNKADWKDI